MKKKLTALTVLLILLFTLCSCTKDTGEGRSFVYPIDEPLSYLDPQIVSSVSGRIAVKNCFEGLVRNGENGEILPAAAEGWSVSGDGKTYTFRLRRDAVWYIPRAVELYGTEDESEKPTLPVTAADFVFAFQRAVAPETGSAYAQSLSSIENAEQIISGKKKPETLAVHAEDDYTFTVKLVSADEDFLNTLTSSVCMPCCRDFFEKTGGRYGIDSSYLIYNGPFYLSSWSDTGSATIKPNESYTGPFKAKPSSVYFSLNSEQETRLEKLIGLTYDAAPLTKEQTLLADEKSGVSVLTFKNGIKGLMFNCSDDVLKNGDLRKAFLYSFRPSDMGYEAMTDIVPDACIASGKNYREISGGVDLPPYNEKTAVRYKNSALRKLKTDSVSVVILCCPDDEQSVRRAMQNWQSVFGIAVDIKCEAVEPSSLQSRVESGDYQIALTALSAKNEYASDFLMGFTSASAYNTVRLKDKKYDALMRKSLDSPSMITALGKAEQYLLEEAVIIPFADENIYRGTAKGVSGMVFNATGELIDFSQAVKFDG